jgi:hypothetical protein
MARRLLKRSAMRIRCAASAVVICERVVIGCGRVAARRVVHETPPPPSPVESATFWVTPKEERAGHASGAAS